MARKYILDEETVRIKLERMAFEVVENNIDEKRIMLVGIRDNGSVIAKCIREHLMKISDLQVDITDLNIDKKNPLDAALAENKDLTGQVVVLVDDVANTGKTMLYALKPFLNFQPKKIQTLALIERTHKTFPLNLDYVGLSMATTLLEHIYVEVKGDTITGAYLE